MSWRCMGEWGCSSTSLNLDTRCRWVVSFTPQSFYSWWKNPWYPLDRRLGWSLNQWSGHWAEEKNLSPLPVIKPWFLGHPAHSLVAIMIANYTQHNMTDLNTSTSTPNPLHRSLFVSLVPLFIHSVWHLSRLLASRLPHIHATGMGQCANRRRLVKANVQGGPGSWGLAGTMKMNG
jgi:hypothetical protein